jgi:hypothetical protein
MQTGFSQESDGALLFTYHESARSPVSESMRTDGSVG